MLRNAIKVWTSLTNKAVPEEKKGRLSGLKRLGTVLNRRKSVVPPLPRPTPSKNRSAARLGSETDLTEEFVRSRTSGTTDRTTQDQMGGPLPPVPRIGDAARPSSSDRGSLSAERPNDNFNTTPTAPMVNGVSRTTSLPPQQPQYQQQPRHQPSPQQSHYQQQFRTQPSPQPPLPTSPPITSAPPVSSPPQVC